MKRHHVWSFVMVIGAALTIGLMAGFVGTGTARADTSTQPALAGLTSDGSVYVDLGDGFWHPIDAATLAADGYDANTVTWYGSLPGTVGTPVPSVIPVPSVAAGNVALAEVVASPPLAGLLSDGSVYVDLGDGYWHYVSASAFVSAGYSWGNVTWYGDLPGTVAPDSTS